MITEEQREESQRERIRILREGYPNDPEVAAWDLSHPAEAVLFTPESQERLTTEEVAAAVETVPAPGVTETETEFIAPGGERRTRKSIVPITPPR